ncbi:Tn3 family transposase [uncultured Roseovarius sp.]|nr:Tn3 family transposase [uncultured Roseovarius sp.]
MLATILAGATNLGVERMAYASSRVSHAQLTWAHELRQGLEQRSSAEG